MSARKNGENRKLTSIGPDALRVLTILVTALITACVAPVHGAFAKAPPSDKLGRQDPRSAVTGFLEACRSRDYQKASQYLDLRQLSPQDAKKQGPELARKLESVLNSDTHFNVLHLSGNPQGDLSDKSNSNHDHIDTITEGGQAVSIDLERVTLQTGGPQFWLFSPDTVAVLPYINTQTTPSVIERFIPPFLRTHQILQTPLWKWAAITILALLLISISRLLDWLLALTVKVSKRRVKREWKLPWLETLVRPLRVILLLAVLRIGIEIIDPSAIARLYLGRGMEIVFAWSIVWCLLRLEELFVNHLEMRLETPQQLASRTMLRLGRRTAGVLIVVFAFLMVLQSWGYNTTTLIAGLGVGGIAVALAAQQTIANIFGGVSLVGDHPIRIGEFGKFGDMTGVVEDIGMRSTRIRTLNRTVVSVPNSNFAGLNLENYSIRDKILFNPTFQIKRATTDPQMHALIEALNKYLSSRADLEPAPTPARVVGLASGSFALEIFCYVITVDINEFYRIQGDLLLGINNIFASSNIELV
jgi:MscS family membrane protein